MTSATINRRFADVVPTPTATETALPSIESILATLVPIIQSTVQFRIARARAISQQQLLTGFPFCPSVLAPLPPSTPHPFSPYSPPLLSVPVEIFPFPTVRCTIQATSPRTAIAPRRYPTMSKRRTRGSPPPNHTDSDAASNVNGNSDPQIDPAALPPTPSKSRSRKRQSQSAGSATRQPDPIEVDTNPLKERSRQRHISDTDRQPIKKGKAKGKGKEKKRTDSGPYLEMKVINGCGPYVYERQYVDGVYKSRYKGKAGKGKSSTDPKPKPPKPSCPDCGSPKTVSNGTDKQRGKRCYKCSHCLYRWRVDLD